MYPCDFQAPFAARFLEKSQNRRLGLCVAEFSVEPGPSEGPKVVGLPAADPHGLGGFPLRESREEAERYQLGGFWGVALELVEGVIEGHDLRGAGIHDAQRLVQFHPDTPAPVLGSPLATGPLHENPPHGLGRGGEEVAAAVPMLGLLRIHQPNVRLVDQGRGLERLAGLLLRHLLGSQFPQLVVDQRQKLFGGRGVAFFDGG
jgi:hypothetical protein